MIKPFDLPFDVKEKIFNIVDSESGEIIGYPYSYNDFIEEIVSISGVSEDLMGKDERVEKFSR